jgi:hypothetical protein
MSLITKQIIEMVDMLPEAEQQLACEVLKRLVLAWDPDFVKLTPFEELQLTQAEKEISTNDLVDHADINWD